jgi:hypothetical protein
VLASTNAAFVGRSDVGRCASSDELVASVKIVGSKRPCARSNSALAAVEGRKSVGYVNSVPANPRASNVTTKWAAARPDYSRFDALRSE